MILHTTIGGPSPFPIPDSFLEAEIAKRLPASKPTPKASEKREEK